MADLERRADQLAGAIVDVEGLIVTGHTGVYFVDTSGRSLARLRFDARCGVGGRGIEAKQDEKYRRAVQFAGGYDPPINLDADESRGAVLRGVLEVKSVRTLDPHGPSPLEFCVLGVLWLGPRTADGALSGATGAEGTR